jgi:hypothetical protein
MRRALALIALVAAPILYLTRRRDERRERVNLYYDDGSMITLERGAAGADRLLEVAQASLR